MKNIDCNNTINFIHECKRMCGRYEHAGTIQSCYGCPFDEKSYCPNGDIELLTSEDINVVQNWSDTHPVLVPTDTHKKYLEAYKTLGFNYIAKDSNGFIHAYETKPINTSTDSNTYLWSTESVTNIFKVTIDFDHLDDYVYYDIDELLNGCGGE